MNILLCLRILSLHQGHKSIEKCVNFCYAYGSESGHRCRDNRFCNDKCILLTKSQNIWESCPEPFMIGFRKDKGIPAHKIGEQWRFRCAELDDWVTSGKSAMDKGWCVHNKE